MFNETAFRQEMEANRKSFEAAMDRVCGKLDTLIALQTHATPEELATFQEELKAILLEAPAVKAPPAQEPGIGVFPPYEAPPAPETKPEGLSAVTVNNPLDVTPAPKAPKSTAKK